MARIRGGQIQHDTISGLHIENKSIEGIDVADNTLTGEHIVNESIPYTKIDPNFALPHDRLNISLLEPIDTSTNLPASANNGDIIVAKDTGIIYVRKDNDWFVGAGGSYSTADFNSDFSSKTTDNLSEGTTNKYFFSHDNTSHTESYITSSGVTFSNLNTNGDVGSGSDQVAVGDHLHGGVYEPVFTKNTAFNKDFGSLSDQIAVGDHLHSGVYEPVFTKNTAFNKDFGSGSNQVSSGDHLHGGVYADIVHHHDDRYYTEAEIDLLVNQDVRTTASPQFSSITSTTAELETLNITSVHPSDTATIFGSESEGNSILHIRIGNGSTDKIQFESWNGSSSSSLLEIGQTDVTILGNLNITGTTTTIDSTTVNVADNEIILNSGVTGSPVLNASITVNRGSSSNSKLLWNETDDKWQVDNGTGSAYSIVNASQILSGSNTFHNTPLSARTITHNFGSTSYYVNITPASPTNGYLGEWYVTNIQNNSFDVVKTGSASNINFHWHLIAI